MSCLILPSTLIISPRLPASFLLKSFCYAKCVCTKGIEADALNTHHASQSPVVENYDLSTVYFIQCGGAPLSAELEESIVRMLPKCTIGQGYGKYIFYLDCLRAYSLTIIPQV